MSVVYLDDYRKKRSDDEQRFLSFKSELEDLIEQFFDTLIIKYTKRTALKHRLNIELFVIYLECFEDVFEFSDLTKNKLNQRFTTWREKKVWNADSDHEINISLKRFFKFIAIHQKKYEFEANRILLLL